MRDIIGHTLGNAVISVVPTYRDEVYTTRFAARRADWRPDDMQMAARRAGIGKTDIIARGGGPKSASLIGIPPSVI